MHVVRDGDSLPVDRPPARTATQTGWRLIAEANGVDNPMHLRRGTALNLPRLD